MKWIFDRTKLRTLRELTGLSLEDFAKAIGKTKESYRLKEEGRTPLYVEELCAIGTKHRIDPRVFFIDDTVAEGKSRAK